MATLRNTSGKGNRHWIAVNLAKLPDEVPLIRLPLKIQEGDGSPVRAVTLIDQAAAVVREIERKTKMVYELRIYRFHPGCKQTFLKHFQVARTFMEKYGVTFVTAWENLEREDEFVWIRSFPSLEDRQKAVDTYYGSPEWLEIVGDIRPTIKRREVRLLKTLLGPPWP